MSNDVNFEGRVSKLYEARFGGGSFGLDGHDRQYFNTKKALPSFVQPGATIKFTAQPGRNGKSFFVTDTSLEEVKGAQAERAKQDFVQSSSSRENGIRYQSSRKDAFAMATLLANAGCLYNDKTPKAKIGGILEDVVDKFTALYYEDVDTLGALERATPREIEHVKAAPSESEGLPE